MIFYTIKMLFYYQVTKKDTVTKFVLRLNHCKKCMIYTFLCYAELSGNTAAT